MQPLVSVRVITYNHVRYIARCIEGLLMQKTDFPFEIIIGEDCSTDGTREIVQEYQTLFPDLIHLITSEQNVGAFNNSIRVSEACRGKYHAFCEGDDFWIDPLKLQRQADFLESHPDYSMCFHDVVVLEERGLRPCTYTPLGASCTPVPIEDIIQNKARIDTGSLMMRASVYYQLPTWRGKVCAPDVVIKLWGAYQGKVGYLPELMSVYRKHSGGMTSNLTPKEFFLDLIYICEEFDKATDFQFTKYLQQAIKINKEQYHRYQLRRKIGYLYFVLFPHITIQRLWHRIAYIINNYKFFSE